MTPFVRCVKESGYEEDFGYRWARFIGSNFIRMLLSKPTVTGLLIWTSRLTLEILKILVNLEVILVINLLQRRYCDADLISFFGEHQPDAVVNFAAESHVDRSIDGPEPFVQTNVVGTCGCWRHSRIITIFKKRSASRAFGFYMCPPMKCTGL